jgi:hypothetical protein
MGILDKISSRKYCARMSWWFMNDLLRMGIDSGDIFAWYVFNHPTSREYLYCRRVLRP